MTWLSMHSSQHRISRMHGPCPLQTLRTMSHNTHTPCAQIDGECSPVPGAPAAGSQGAAASS